MASICPTPAFFCLASSECVEPIGHKHDENGGGVVARYINGLTNEIRDEPPHGEEGPIEDTAAVLQGRQKSLTEEIQLDYECGV